MGGRVTRRRALALDLVYPVSGRIIEQKLVEKKSLPRRECERKDRKAGKILPRLKKPSLCLSLKHD